MALALLAMPLKLLAEQAGMPLFLEVFVNGQDTELVIEASQGPEGKLKVPHSELAAVGIETRDLAGAIADLDGIPGLAWRYEVVTQRLYLTAGPERLAPVVVGPGRVEQLSSDPSLGAALNYDLNIRAGDSARGGFRMEGASIGIDAWAFWNHARLGTTGLATLPVDDGADLRWTRYETALHIDRPDRAVTMTLGDTVTSSLSWGRAVRIGGVRVARDFSLRRDLVRQPLPGFEGSVAVPTTVDVFIEGNRVFGAELLDGRFRLDDIPIISGNGTALITLRGADGTVTRTELPFYGARALLRRGLVDWSIEAGRPRLAFATEADGYGSSTVVNGILRYGLTDRITMELQAAGTRDFRHLAIGHHAVVGNRAEVSLSYGESRHADRRGHFHNATISARPFGLVQLEASHFRSSADYVDLASAIDLQLGAMTSGPDRQRDVISFSLPSGRRSIGFGLSHIRIKRDSGSRSELTSLGASVPLPRLDTVLNLSAAHDWRNRDSRIAALMTLKLGRQTVQASQSSTDGGGVLVSRMTDGSFGSWGYTVEADRLRGNDRLSARVWSQRRLARVEATARHNNDRTGLSLRLQGAFAMMDRRVTAGPPITGSFAVVDLGQADMPVRLQNRIVTRTGRNGRALVTGLQPFSRNRLAVDQLDGDSGAVWHVTSFEAIPSRRSGIHVPLGASQSAAQQMVQLEDASGRAPAPGTPVTIAGKAHPLGVGYDGLLLLESPRPGAPIRAGACTARVPPPRDDGLPAVALCE